MPYVVYILHSPRLDRFYVGQTSNIEDRLHRHNSGYEKFTSKGVPWTLCWFTRKESRAASVALEQKLKNLSRSRLQALMLKYAVDLTAEGRSLLRRFEP